jgi:hypothetical protein
MAMGRWNPPELRLCEKDRELIPEIKGTDDSSSYAFDVKTISGSPFLINRRVFAFPDAGIIAFDILFVLNHGANSGPQSFPMASNAIQLVTYTVAAVMASMSGHPEVFSLVSLSFLEASRISASADPAKYSFSERRSSGLQRSVMMCRERY